MAKITWHESGERIYETGVSHGVLYVMGSDGNYQTGVPWNGLVSVTESPTGAEASAHYADNIKYLNLLSAEELNATVEAFTYPDEFGVCDGTAEPTPGLSIGQQHRRKFALAYRTIKGNEDAANEFGYKLHILYGCQASPSEKGYQTVNDSPEPITFSWELTTNPVNVSPEFKPTALIIADSTKLTAANMSALEDALYGTATEEARVPLPTEIVDMLSTP